MAETGDALARAWALCYLDPVAARIAGHEVAASPGPDSAWGWWHVALAEIRAGTPEASALALARARTAFGAAAPAQAALGMTMCDEIQAIALRRGGDVAGCKDLLDTIDRQTPDPADGGLSPECDALRRFIGHNSRAITHKLLGNVDDGLRHFYAAADAAAASGNAGARLTALSNLGGYHQDLFNLDDALGISEQALAEALAAASPPLIGTTCSNLVIIHHALGQADRAFEKARFLVEHPDALMPGAIDRLRTQIALGHLAVGKVEAAQRWLSEGASAQIADGDGAVPWAWVQAQVSLAQGNPAHASAVAAPLLRDTARARASTPYDLMQLLRAQAQACEQLGDLASALAHTRSAQSLYEELVGRSARARHRALQVRHELSRAESERDQARRSQLSAEADRARLAELNSTLQAKIAEIEDLHRELREQALRDPLTGLHNRRYLFESGPGLLELARRNERPLVVAVLDLDHFKLINDTFGHQAGDAVLRRFAHLLHQVLRKSDVIIRHGGEEFVALMPEITAEGAAAVLARLQEACHERTPSPGGRPLPTCSFSAGLAVFPRQGQTLDQLLVRADRALYSAKHHGRGRIERAPATGFSSLE
ncbi:MAG: diguanylate cyclase [Rubrivivax sp.]|nr:diguanylate cyclase [Rubrivivax sp.]